MGGGAYRPRIRSRACSRSRRGCRSRRGPSCASCLATIATEDEVTVWKANAIKRRPTFNGSSWYFVDDEVSIIFNTLELDGDGCTTGDICTKIITLSQEYLQQRYNIELDCQFTIVEDAKDHPSYSSLIADREIYHAYNTTYNKILVLNINNLYRPTREQTEELYRRGAY